MSAIIRTGWMKYKNPITGEYQSIDAITDATTAERVAAVESAIDAKASAAIESIPADYTELSEEVDSLLAGALSLSSSLVETLPSNTDFDTLTTAGSYRIATNTAAASMDNCPSATAGRLIILQSSQSARLFQYYITNGNSCRIYVRWYGYDEVWFEWKYLATSDEIMDIKNHLFSAIPFTNDGAGFVNYGSGDITSSDNYDHTDFIEVSQCTSLQYKRAKSTADSSSVSMCFYNASREVVGKEKCLTGQEELGYVEELRSIVVPQNALYARFSIYHSTELYGDFELYGYYKIAETVKNAIGQRILESTNDSTDRTADILFRLKNYGKVVLGNGIFYTTGIDMPDDTAISGSGNSTIILETSATRSAIKLGNRCRVNELNIFGATEDIVLDGAVWNGESVVTRCAIGLSGDNTTAGGPERCMLSQVTIKHFKGIGIRASSTSTATSNCLNVSDCYIENCDAGIFIVRDSEYHRFTGVHISNCYYGCINNGGNNGFVNCGFNLCTVGYSMGTNVNAHPNDGHGTFVGCVLHHNGGNDTNAFEIVGLLHGFTITGCTIGGKILIKDSDSVIFSGCRFGTNASITVDGGSKSYATGCLWTRVGDPTYESINDGEFEFSDIPKLSIQSLRFNFGGSGYINYSTGEVDTSATAYDYTDYIDISSCVELRYTRIQVTLSTSNVGMCFYDADKVRISGEQCVLNQGSRKYIGSLTTIPVPFGAKYARFSAIHGEGAYGDFYIEGVYNVFDAIDYALHQEPVQTEHYDSFGPMMTVAESYFNAAYDPDERFIWHSETGLFNENTEWENEKSIVCSMFIEACLYGIYYENSRYVKSSNERCEWGYVTDGTGHYASLYEQGFMDDYMTSANLARYCEDHGWLYEFNPDRPGELKPGDILFLSIEGHGTWNDICHCALCIRPYKTLVCIAESTSSTNSYIRHSDNRYTGLGIRNLGYDSDGRHISYFARMPLTPATYKSKLVDHLVRNLSGTLSSASETIWNSWYSEKLEPGFYTIIFDDLGETTGAIARVSLDNPSGYSDGPTCYSEKIGNRNSIFFYAEAPITSIEFVVSGTSGNTYNVQDIKVYRGYRPLDA